MSYGEQNNFRVEDGLSALRLAANTNDTGFRLHKSLDECFGGKSGFRVRTFSLSDDPDTRQVGARLFYSGEVVRRFEGTVLGRKQASLLGIISNVLADNPDLTADTPPIHMSAVTQGIGHRNSENPRAYVAVQPDAAGYEYLVGQRRTILNAVEAEVRVKRTDWEPEDSFEIKLVTAPADTPEKTLRSIGTLIADYFPLELQFGKTMFEPDPRLM